MPAVAARTRLLVWGMRGHAGLALSHPRRWGRLACGGTERVREGATGDSEAGREREPHGRENLGVAPGR